MAITRDPLPLTQGKAGDAIFACLQDSYLMARDHGHQGYTIAHVPFDGALHNFLSRRVRQWHLRQAIGRAAEQRRQGLDPQQLQLLEWVVDTQCCPRMLQSGLALSCLATTQAA